MSNKNRNSFFIELKKNKWYKRTVLSVIFLFLFVLAYPLFEYGVKIRSYNNDFTYSIFEHFIYGCVISSLFLLVRKVYLVELTNEKITVLLVNGLNIKFRKTIPLDEINYYLLEGHFNSGDDRITLLNGKKRVVKISKGAIGDEDFERFKNELGKIKDPINH